MALVDEIGTRLTAASVGGLPGSTQTYTIYYRELTETPDKQIAIVPTGGSQQEHAEAVERPSFQVLVRGAANSSTDLEAKVNDVVDALNLWDGTISGRRYIDIQRSGDILYLGRDENQRPMYSVNFGTVRSRTT
jgi:hypothetical protein